jgi:hypothetical protein
MIMPRYRTNLWAAEANDRGTRCLRAGNPADAVDAFRDTCLFAPFWPVAWVNLAIAFKHVRDWHGALGAALRAIELEPDAADVRAHRTVGLAATMLGEWERARWAWRECGLSVSPGAGPIVGDFGLAALEVHRPLGAAEVWCRRTDPVRGRIVGVPPPGSGRHHADVVLYDTEQIGRRQRRGVAYPRFEELLLLEPSPYRTWIVDVVAPSRVDLDELRSRCDGADLCIEDWSALPAEDAYAVAWAPERRLGVAARERRELDALTPWQATRPGRGLSEPRLAVVADETAA